ncbi:hypothetical protein ISS06_02480 [Patescibacteria group bacterium]|nr:hypothetical protein [Patescibacteria group bacterium]
MNQKNIRGFTVLFRAPAKQGVDHLAYTLSSTEMNSIFRNARISGKIKFEDRQGRNFTLISKHNGKYVVKKRSGWF